MQTPRDHARHRAVSAVIVMAVAGLTVSLIGVAPAFATAPTISSFTPPSGPVGTSVTISGGGFSDSSDVTAVSFNGTAATTFSLDSNVNITATVPAGATTGLISVTDSEGTATSSTNFTVTASPVPSITSFTPTSGAIGTSVTINGTGFTGATAVKFNGTTATTVTVNSDTKITATVPTGATTGPISVTTPGGTATSSTNFTVVTTVTHERSVSLRLRDSLVARGVVSSSFAACVANVPVKIQRRGSAGWRTIRRAQTDGSGAYHKQIPDRSGRYRALVRKLTIGTTDVCSRDVSPVVRHE